MTKKIIPIRSSLISIFKTIRSNSYILLLWRIAMVLLVFQVSRVLFYLFNQSHFPGMTTTHLIDLMKVGFKFDMTATLYTQLIFVAGWLFPFPWRFRPGYQTGLKVLYLFTNALAMMANIADFVYFRFTLRRTDFEFFKEFGGNKIDWASIFSSGIVDYWYLFLLYIGIMVFLFLAYGKKAEPSPWERRPMHYYIVSCILFPIMLGLTVGGIRGGFRATRPIKISNAGYKVNNEAEIAIVLNTPFSIYLSTTSDFYQPIHEYTEEELVQRYNPVHPGDSTGNFQPKNVVIIILESFSKEYSKFYNDSIDDKPFRGYTPFLDSLAAHSRTSDLGYANGQKSIDAVPSILGSIPSLIQPFVVSKYAVNALTGIGDLLKEKGYQAAFFHGAPNGSMGFDAMTNLLGFDQYFGMNEFADPRYDDGVWGIYDLQFLQFTAQKMNELKEPFVASVFTVTSHYPFKIPKELDGKFPKGVVPMYECVGYTDYSLKKFFETASKMPWFKNTLFVITPDHSRFSDEWKQYRTPFAVFSIPIIFYDGDQSIPAKRDSVLMQQIDIMPTVLGYLKYDKPYFAFGRDYFKEDQTPFAINYNNNLFQFAMGDYVIFYDGKVTKYMYNFKKDKYMTNNLAGTLPEIQSELEAQIKAVIQQYTNRMIDNKLHP